MTRVRRLGDRGHGRPAGRLPRTLHPGAWWLWAIGMGTAASRTTNPVLLVLVVAVVAYVVAARRTEAPWARGFKAYLVLGLVVIAIRVGFRALLGSQTGEHVLFSLPEIPLPDLAEGIRLGGPVALEGLLAALYDGMRLATLLICLGAANVLANPKRLLKALPSALHEAGVAVTVALTIAPQLIESALRVARARRLRGEPGRRLRLLHEVGIPVMTDALERSLLLAAAMDSRGYGRAGSLGRSTRAVAGGLVLAGLAGVCVGTYGLLDATTSGLMGLPMLLAGITASTVGMVLGGRRVRTSRYRPDPWRGAEWAVAGSGITAAAVIIAVGNVDPSILNPSLEPLQWPMVTLLPVVGILIGALPAVLAPPVAITTGAPASPSDDRWASDGPARIDGSGPRRAELAR